MASPRLKAMVAEAIPNVAGELGVPSSNMPQLVETTLETMVKWQAASLNSVLLVPPQKWHEAHLPKELFFGLHNRVYRKYPSAPRPPKPFFGLNPPPSRSAPSTSGKGSDPSTGKGSIPSTGKGSEPLTGKGADSSTGKGTDKSNGKGTDPSILLGKGASHVPPVSTSGKPANVCDAPLFRRTTSSSSTAAAGPVNPVAAATPHSRSQQPLLGSVGKNSYRPPAFPSNGATSDDAAAKAVAEVPETTRWGRGRAQQKGKMQRGGTGETSSTEQKGTADHLPGGVFRTASSLLGKRNRSDSGDHQNCKSEKNENKETKKDDETKKEDEMDEVEKKILQDILCERPNVSFDDIIGLDGPKESLRQMIILPLLNPDIYTGLREPPKGLLMFGPGGNGKTFIAKAVASECVNVTFFNLSAASLTSKWLGESEKLMRALFAVAKRKAPSLIFIDEIDSILSKRGDTDNEASRRLKTEFLVQFDGVASSDSGGGRVIFLAATNRPWDLDEAALRRFTERFYVPLPTREARHALLTKLLRSEDHCVSDADIEELVNKMEGYAAFEVQGVCRRAAQQQMRELSFEVARTINKQQLRPLCLSDFHKALKVVRAANSSNAVNEHAKWNTDYGAQD